jgi:hypothetical protein
MREKRDEHVMVHLTQSLKARVVCTAQAGGMSASALLNLILAENLARYEKSVGSGSAKVTSRKRGSAKVASTG